MDNATYRLRRCRNTITLQPFLVGVGLVALLSPGAARSAGAAIGPEHGGGGGGEGAPATRRAGQELFVREEQLFVRGNVAHFFVLAEGRQGGEATGSGNQQARFFVVVGVG